MISRYIRVSLKEENLGVRNTTNTINSYTLYYPCKNTTEICTPYVLDMKPGAYKIECWGSTGKGWYLNSFHSYPGRGAYTSGIIAIEKQTKMYAYIGERGFFNSAKNVKTGLGYSGGGATDLRLVSTENWYDISSLKSRIMVAAGGGGAEWPDSVGGNGGALNGEGSTFNDKYGNKLGNCTNGASQTSGFECPSYETEFGIPARATGSFGSAGFLRVEDGGGFGGGGYYGGSSYEYSLSGTGGSSFISGYKGCDAIIDSETIEHSGQSVHYSNYVFSQSIMIEGNQTMPLPGNIIKEGIWDNFGGGAFRITLLEQSCPTLKYKMGFPKLIPLFPLMILMH